MISIIDYGAGNLNSVEKAVRFLGFECTVTGDRDEILSSDKLILPGVGAFEDAMKHLQDTGLHRAVYDAVEKKIPILGICLGMQLFYEQSEEGNGPLGLGILKGKIKRFPDTLDLKIPQMGWNNLKIQKKCRLFDGLENPYVYFVHSYYLEAENRNEVAATCEYGISFDAAVETGSIFLTQFHPEKSGETGLKILKNFME
ncbi:imidazole glycerol phosphate synthase subunit HisH [Acetivibrio sp. MSJd-27]|uniref:imidazole glycerol phosphate synthase subunit HisH n=1 Tax=Acetivibrio sp. MSJd-27 TaxID=2841523 RepID=UPI001C1096C4|nr:imidazole glycerol phosphate synthase subunit HisH [Acetivibrio sp. MSJd-27]MBU5449805.1 imidazole glycerol phosphate synthase subunit HisH [Acetivibrio sp. MSJd-27]